MESHICQNRADMGHPSFVKGTGREKCAPALNNKDARFQTSCLVTPSGTRLGIRHACEGSPKDLGTQWTRFFRNHSWSVPARSNGVSSHEESWRRGRVSLSSQNRAEAISRLPEFVPLARKRKRRHVRHGVHIHDAEIARRRIQDYLLLHGRSLNRGPRTGKNPGLQSRRRTRSDRQWLCRCGPQSSGFRSS